MSTKDLPRLFRYNNIELEDPGREHDAVDVRNLYAATYPEITSAAIEGPEQKDGKIVYTFRRAVGTKGNARAILEQHAAGTAARPRGNAVLPTEHAKAATMAAACRDLVSSTLGAGSYDPFDTDDNTKTEFFAAPSEALPPLP